MRTFSELLREYIGRTGVSDAELARAVGVQRQTIFRWKEGLVARPRDAEDVLHLAVKLRLTPAERDELLLAAGFPPATRTPDLGIALPDAGVATPSRSIRPRWRLWAITGGLVLLIAATAVFAVMRQRAGYPRAAEGETLIVIAQFGNYTGGAQGYNVAGRLGEALERELAGAGLKSARVAMWPAAVADAQTATDALERSGAALLIWGEYDSGRVVARFLPRANSIAGSRELSLLAATPAELPAVINSSLPGDIRYLALYSLAQMYVDQSQPAPARAALGQAALNLPADPGTRAAHYFFWAYANQVAQPPDLDAAIEGYTEALKFDDELEAANDNRALAFLRRRWPGDAAAAVGDLTRYLVKHVDDANAFNNRGSAYFFLGGSDNARLAVADFDRAIALEPDSMTGYYNRGLAYVRLDEGPKWRADLQRALDGGHPGAEAALCWGFSLSEEPATAIEQCSQALAANGDTGPLENLGLAYARMGQYDQAAAALRRYRDDLRAAGAGEDSEKVRQLDGWVAALGAGKNPFDAEALRRLREE
jgi:tetratricopeptide (TPR) repeat protein